MDVVMPQLGETATEGTVAAWHKKAGDTVQKGDMLLDVETDKVATAIVAPQSGVLSSINVADGETVDVGTVLAVIAGEGEVVAETVAKATPEPVAAAAPIAAKSSALPSKSAGNRLSPAVRRLLKEHSLDVAELSNIAGTGRDGKVTRDDVLDYVQSAGSDSGAA